MPLYEFECNYGHRYEKLFNINECPIKIPCEDCSLEGSMEFAEKVWSVPAGDLSNGKPTRMFINNRTGEPFAPISRYDKPPRGYHEIELRNPSERTRFEKEQQQRLDGQNQLTSHILDSMKAEARKKRHDNLKARMNAVQREEYTDDEGKTKVEEFTLTERDKALVNKAMEKSRKKPRKEKKSNVMFAINHYDKSNIDEVK